MNNFCLALLALATPSLVGAQTVSARPDTVYWASWTSPTNNDHTAGSAGGSIRELGLNVTYRGEVEELSVDYPSWTPSRTFRGGTVGNAPPKKNNAIALQGGYGAVDVITFSQPITNPSLAIWSLGDRLRDPGIEAKFTFNAQEPFTVVAGGGSGEYGGASIYVCPDDPHAVCGKEGNGIVQFSGTYSSITWTNPVYENWYAFTVGAHGLANVLSTISAPAPTGLSASVFIAPPVCLSDKHRLCTPEKSSVESLGGGRYRIRLPANLVVSIPNPDGRRAEVSNAEGKVCWDTSLPETYGCNGPEGNGNLAGATFVSPAGKAGALIVTTEPGRTTLMVNGRSANAIKENDGSLSGFSGHEGYFELDLRIH